MTFFAAPRTPPRSPWRLLALLALAHAGAIAAVSPLRVVVVAPERTANDGLVALETALAAQFHFQLPAQPRTDSASAHTALAGLRDADAAIVHRGPGPLSAENAAQLHAFLAAGKPLVLLAAAPEAWPSEPQFASDVLGAMQGGAFASGAALTIINLFSHPILTGVTRLETDQPVPLYTKLADDAQMIMEGTVGEATAPLAWVRRRAAGSVVHFVFGTADVLRDSGFQRLVGQAVLWASGRPIPGAAAIVQRTYMPDAYPGAFAVTLPEGPGVCLDPVRGGINYVWAGDFVDLRPRWLTKQGEPARLFGPIFYRETRWQPFRAGSPGAEPDFQFRGYSLRDGTPEFHYQIGGRDVYETLSAGSVAGALLRRFRVAPGSSPLWLELEPQPDADVTVRGLERDGNMAAFTSAAGGEFTIEIRRKSVPTP